MNKELNGIKFGLLSKENKFPDCKFENINFIKSKFFFAYVDTGKKSSNGIYLSSNKK